MTSAVSAVSPSVLWLPGTCIKGRRKERRKRGTEKEEGWREGLGRRKSDHQMSPKDNSPLALTGINIAVCGRARPLPAWQEHLASLVHGNALSLPFAISMALALDTGMESYLCPVAFPVEHHKILLLCRRCYPTHSRGHYFQNPSSRHESEWITQPTREKITKWAKRKPSRPKEICPINL